ncbi:MAG TPA: DUF4157 domain-containing protein [Longimicrobium sp.]|nr:DUF4157 domain-containing protein [Longimicrobium sp.]
MLTLAQRQGEARPAPAGLWRRAAAPGVLAPSGGARDVGAEAGLPRFLHDFGRIATHPSPAAQPLAVGGVNDASEHQADAAASQVMRMPGAGGSGAPSIGPAPAAVQMKAGGPGGAEVAQAPPVVHDALRSPGQPLPASARAFFEPRFGHDFGQVRVHADPLAARSAASVNAAAYTVGNHVVFGSGRYAPESGEGQRLMAHELAHVVQQRSGAPSVQRFHLPHGADPAHQVDESSVIAPTFSDLLATVQAIISAATMPGSTQVNMDDFVQKAGGQPVTKAVDKALGTKSTPKGGSMLNFRYQFTCRCGFLDLRHFLQLMYIANFVASAFPGTSGNRVATKKGREHELTSESESRFGPEDTVSNALGAYTGQNLAGLPQAGPLFDAIKATLERCGPVDWTSLSPSSQDVIKHHYGDLVPDFKPKKAGDLVPKNQNTTALPDILSIPECGGKERSFPFMLDEDDPDRKTISGKAFDKGAAGLTSDSEIRDFVATQRPEHIQGLAAAEKVRLVKRLLQGYVHDDDITAVESIYNRSSSAERAQIRAAVNPDDLWSVGQRTRLRSLFSTP